MTSNSYRAIGVSIVYLALLAMIAAAGFVGAMVLADPLAPLALKLTMSAIALILVLMAIGFGLVVLRELRDERRAKEQGSTA